ncbi:MAG: hypothetical protein FJ038_03465 [Chloroflexi bacterium]|nr:hypothetical protein [Chloroflexota bacterium]
MGAPVVIAWMLVRPGDAVVADNDGSIAIPSDQLPGVATAAEGILAFEARVHRALDAGLTFRDFLAHERGA